MSIQENSRINEELFAAMGWLACAPQKGDESIPGPVCCPTRPVDITASLCTRAQSG